jgi:hypothetical protein
MIEISKKLIEKCVEALLEASKNYGGTATQFARKYGMSASVWSEIKNGRTEGKLSPQKWLNIAAILGVKDTDRVWRMARTEVFNAIEEGVMACKEYGWGMIFVDKCAIGKTYSAKYLAKTLKNCFYVDGSQCKTKILFTRTLAQVIGVESAGRYQDVKLRIKNALNVLEKPVVIIDEAGDLEYNAFLDLKEFYNATEGSCGWYMMGANGLRKKITDGISRESVGFEEIFSRFSDAYAHVVPTNKDEQIDFYRRLLTDVLSVNMTDRTNLNKLVNQCLTVGTGNNITGLRRAEKILILNS